MRKSKKHTPSPSTDLKMDVRLLKAAETQNLAMVQALIAVGANKRAHDSTHNTALHYAARNGNLTIGQLLIKYRANKEARNKFKFTPLHFACQFGQLHFVEMLVSSGVNTELYNSNEQTPLHLAVRYGHFQIVRTLLRAGADKSARDALRLTPLHTAASQGHVQIVQELIRKGVNLELHDCFNRTPLHIAASSGQLAVVEILVNAGANVHAIIQADRSPIVLAYENHHHAIVRLLRNFGAQLPRHLTAPRQRREVINDIQSVHTVSVHRSISESAQRLKAHYFNLTTKEINHQIAFCLKQLNKFIDRLAKSFPYNSNHPYAVSKRCLTYLHQINYNFIDERSGVTLKEALALVWLGLKDPKEMHRKRLEKNVVSKVVRSSAGYTTEEMQEIAQTLSKGLFEAMREYNLSDTGLDNGNEDAPSCLPGIFNKLINILNGGQHSLVHISFVNSESIKAKADSLINNIFSELPTKEQEKYAFASDENMSSDFIDYLKPRIQPLLTEEFKTFQSAGIDVHTIIKDYVDNLEYLSAPSLLSAFKIKSNQLLQRQAHTHYRSADSNYAVPARRRLVHAGG